MRQIWITRTGAPEVLAVKEAPDPATEGRRGPRSGRGERDQLRRHSRPHGPLSRPAADSGRARLRGERPGRRRRPGRRGRLDRTRRHRHDALRRLCGHGLRPRKSGVRAPGRHVGLGGRRHSRQLLHRLAACRGHGRPQAQRDRSRAFGGRRRRHRRDADRQAPRRPGDRNGFRQ